MGVRLQILKYIHTWRSTRGRSQACPFVSKALLKVPPLGWGLPGQTWGVCQVTPAGVCWLLDIIDTFTLMVLVELIRHIPYDTEQGWHPVGCASVRKDIPPERHLWKIFPRGFGEAAQQVNFNHNIIFTQILSGQKKSPAEKSLGQRAFQKYISGLQKKPALGSKGKKVSMFSSS